MSSEAQGPDLAGGPTHRVIAIVARGLSGAYGQHVVFCNGRSSNPGCGDVPGAVVSEAEMLVISSLDGRCWAPG